MTYAPADLLAVRQYLLGSTGLSGDAVGIVGDPDHASTGGYHEGNDDLARVGRLSTDYSKRESARDRPGSNAASALDIGDFTRGAVSLRSVSLSLVAACQRGDPRTRDIREVIFTPDGATVRRFDRLGIRSTGDSSHLYHTHISFFRDSEGRRAGADNVLGLVRELIDGIVDDMGGEKADGILANTVQVDNALYSMFKRLMEGVDPYWSKLTNGGTLEQLYAVEPALRKGNLSAIARQLDQLLAAATADAARDAANTAAITALTEVITAGGGSVDAVAIRAAIVDAVHDAVEPLQARIAELQHEADERDARLAEALDPDQP